MGSMLHQMKRKNIRQEKNRILRVVTTPKCKNHPMFKKNV
jgi:hypothetical protein